MLADSYLELNDIHSRSVIIPPQNHLSVTLTRDPSINILSLLYPINILTSDLHKKKFTTAELKAITQFTYGLSDELDKR